MQTVPAPLLLAVLLSALATPALASDCGTPETTSNLQTQIEAGQTAYGELDIDRFTAATTEMDQSLDCIGDPIPRNLVAEIHRTQGLRFFVGQESEKAKLAFAAARAIQPNYQFPESLIPRGNPVLDVYDAIPLSLAASTEIEVPAGTYWQIDGRSGTERPTTWPTLLQLFDEEGAVLHTAYLWPEDAVPAWTPPETTTTTGGGSGVNVAKVGMFAGAGLAAVGAGVAYFAASNAKSTYDDQSTPYDDLDGLRRQVNTRVLVSTGLGVTAVGLGVGGVFVGEF